MVLREKKGGFGGKAPKQDEAHSERRDFGAKNRRSQLFVPKFSILHGQSQPEILSTRWAIH